MILIGIPSGNIVVDSNAVFCPCWLSIFGHMVVPGLAIIMASKWMVILVLCPCTTMVIIKLTFWMFWMRNEIEIEKLIFLLVVGWINFQFLGGDPVILVMWGLILVGYKPIFIVDLQVQALNYFAQNALLFVNFLLTTRSTL